jgi:hypothetical protein
MLALRSSSWENHGNMQEKISINGGSFIAGKIVELNDGFSIVIFDGWRVIHPPPKA